MKKYNPSVVLLHSFFGFNTLGNAADTIREIKEQGVTIIEDYTQRLFSTFPSINANYEVGSIRKWYPIPDGAFLRGDIVVNPDKEDGELAEKKIKGFLDKGKYVEDGSVEKEVFMKELNDAENLLDSRSETYLISKISKKIISASNKDSLIKKRRANYIALLVCCALHVSIIGKEKQERISELFGSPFRLRNYYLGLPRTAER